MIIYNLEQQIGIINISGFDSKNFLQGQVTNDINLSDTRNAIFATHLNNKGRVLGAFIIKKISDDSYYLLTTLDLVKNIIPRLKMFVLRSKVQINQIDNKKIILCEHNDIQYQNLKSLTINNIDFNITKDASIFVLNDPNPPINIIDVKIDYGFKWHEFLINNNIPFIYTETEGCFVPQHINYDTLGGICFTKGCYVGQEIVARTHYLGKTKRRMYQFNCELNNVKIGQPIISPKMNNQTIGTVVDVISQNNKSFGLASIQTDCDDSAFILQNDMNFQLKLKP